MQRQGRPGLSTTDLPGFKNLAGLNLEIAPTRRGFQCHALMAVALTEDVCPDTLWEASSAPLIPAPGGSRPGPNPQKEYPTTAAGSGAVIGGGWDNINFNGGNTAAGVASTIGGGLCLGAFALGRAKQA